MSQSFLDSLSLKLTTEASARLVPRRSASVAVIFRDAQDDEEVILIRRAEREGDPWSGQVAFPGGMVTPADKSFEDTAKREAAEEVGVDLSSGAAVFRGYMRDFRARTKEVVVVPSVFKLVASSAPAPNQEVASCEWASLGELAGEEARSSYLIPKGGGQIPFPCIVHRGLVIWGMTERILSAIIRGRTDAAATGLQGKSGATG
ncbi:MAG TPA: CoA pyrophosphatase [Nitrososphaerales archaeon]|nr:CoA pyrophosphatase [Nitrososphaerales archaeon]